MEGSRKMKIIVSFVLVLILVTVGIVFSVINNKARQAKNDVVLGQTDISNVPYIVSVPPVVGYVGIEYVYDVKYSDRDSELKSITVSLENAPEWLYIDALHVYGTPPVGSSGQYEFDVKISDGKNSSVQRNYILVQDNEEE